jgi:hypothetical protein
LWAEALHKNVDQTGGAHPRCARDRLAVLHARGRRIGRAKENPARYQDQTWILSESNLESTLSIPRDSAKAFVFVLNAQGNVIARVEGAPNDGKIIEVEKQSARPSSAARRGNICVYCAVE